MWKSIVGYEGLYEVSDTGEVRSVARVVKRGKGFMKIRSRVLLQDSSRGYCHVCLSKDGKQYTCHTRQLVAHAFIGPCPAGCMIYSKDQHHGNHHVDNLVYLKRGSVVNTES